MTRRGIARSRAWPLAFAAMVIALAAHADDTPPASLPAAGAQPDPIGRTTLVVNTVDGQLGDAPARHIAVNDDVVFAEDITTGADAKTVIEFRDGSTFEVGADAVIRIDSFVFNPEESTSHKAVQVTRGVFRYVSGYVASDQDTKIKTPAGEMGIRGSVVAGIVDPDVPSFVYVGEGAATFTNGAGSSDLGAGGAIAVPSAVTPPMAAAAMPPAVAAQALQVIERHLPPRASVPQPTADEAWLKRTGAADLVPVAEQRQRETALAASRSPPAPAARGSLAGELGLLAEGNRVNLFRGGQGARTPEQTAFLTRAARENPAAAATVHRFNLGAQELHRTSTAAGTALVLRGVGHAAPSAEIMRRVTAASVRANPGAAAEINRHAGEAYRGADRGQLFHPGGTNPVHPEERKATPHAPLENREFHQNQPPQQRGFPPQQHGFTPQQQPQQRNVAPQQQHTVTPKPPLPKQPLPPPKQPPGKEPPPKKKPGEENQH